ncbi:MAG: flagellar biosynthesis protein FlhA [Rhodocyclales bacterium]|nr:flagellar biosynthesis protein FlhA [Rhodocyclales bacterium]
MAEMLAAGSPTLRLQLRQLAAPILIILILSMMVLPLPPFALDVFFTFNIALSVMVLLVAMYTLKPLDFSVFPTVLLVTTLLRLSLNVASVRVVLLQGHTGPDAAGKVIEAFGHFLVGGNYAVGIVVFIILTVINASEADFYGSMDGASKFVRGDAVAGILILLISVIGGLIVGVLQHDMEVGMAARNYTLLTIGDGLVAQIPALIISTAAGLVVTRVGDDDKDIGQQFVSQVFGNPMVLVLTASILGILGLIPGMPNFVFLLLAGVLAGLAWWTQRRRKTEVAAAKAAPAVEETPQESHEASWSDVAPVDVLGLEVGYRLIPLVDKGQDGELLKRIRGLRKKFAQEVGFMSAPVHIRDNLELKPNAYRITLKGVEVGLGEAYPGMYLAINPGRVSGALPGNVTKDPAFGLPAIWIEAALRDQAQVFGYTVVDAGTVVATHLNHVILTHAAELLGRQEAQALLDHIAKDAPKLIEDLVPKLLPLATVQRVLQNLLEEGVNIRDMRSIVETLAEHAPRNQDPTELTSQVRIALGRAIVQQLYPGSGEMKVIALEPGLERILGQAVQGGAGAVGASGIEPGLADTLLRETAAAAQRMEELGLPPVLLVPGHLRWLLSRFLRRAWPNLKVLANAEIPESRTIRMTSIIGAKS